MPNEIDRSILDRLQALRGSSPKVTAERASRINVSVDLVERSTTPTRDDALAARLKSLRAQEEASPSASLGSSSEVDGSAAQSTPLRPRSARAIEALSRDRPRGFDESCDDVDAMFQTDDQTLEELLGEASAEENPANQPSADHVKASLEELSRSVPRDAAAEGKQPSDDEDMASDSDDSGSERMQRAVDHLVAKFRDEAELEATLGRSDDDDDDDEMASEKQQQQQQPHQVQDQGAEDSSPTIALPSLPSHLDCLPSTTSPRASSADIDDITARMAALRAPTTTTTDTNTDDDDDDDELPSVPSSKPSGQPVKRLTTRTSYTDDDMDGWCVVCLEDATLRCLGCDDDVYCTRCWREMHVGPSAGFDERSHRAVQFTKAKKEKRKVALGA